MSDLNPGIEVRMKYFLDNKKIELFEKAEFADRIGMIGESINCYTALALIDEMQKMQQTIKNYKND